MTMTQEMLAVLSNAQTRTLIQAEAAAEARRDLERKIVWASQSGATYKEIGQVLGVSVARIGQIVAPKKVAPA
jgi:hypothetical protein